MCSPFYCPTLELKSSNLSAAHNAKVQILLLNLCSISRTWSCYKKKKKKPADAQCTACLCCYIMSVHHLEVLASSCFFVHFSFFQCEHPSLFDPPHPTGLFKVMSLCQWQKHTDPCNSYTSRLSIQHFAHCKFELHCSELHYYMMIILNYLYVQSHPG